MIGATAGGCTQAICPSMSYSVVWFKRDLRLNDHAALSQALYHGPVLCLYIVEPSLWRSADAATQHYHFLLESLRDLYREFKRCGGLLQVVSGEAIEVLDRLYALKPFHSLYSHQETGNALSYTRDRAVAHWCRLRAIPWRQSQHFGVTRGLKDRDLWKDLVRRWLLAMRRVPDTWLLEPWKMPHSLQVQHNVYVGKDLSVPIVELEASTRVAKQKLYALRAQPHVRATKREVVHKHGSRKRIAPVKQKTVSAPAGQQHTLDF